MLIREAKSGDITGIAKVNLATWKSTYRGIIPDEKLALVTLADRKEYMRGILASQDQFIYVAESETGRVVGFVAAGPERLGNLGFQGEIYVIYVLQQFQRKGIGRRLVEAMRSRFQQAGVASVMVWALHDNPYQRFYLSLGGMITHTRTLNIDGFQTLERAYGWWDMGSMILRPDQRTQIL